ncbi:replication initiation protein, partial [Vagococcus fluvialis]
MANEIVKYHHELNTIPLRKFSPVEMNLFFSIISRLRDKGDQTVRFSFEQLKDLSDYKATANARFVDDLKSTYEKILSLRFGRRSESGLSVEMFVMFTRFKINGDVDEPYVDIQLFEDALPLLNGLDEWVRYSLQQFNDLQSSYSKTMFRLLKQFRTTGYAYFSKEDFNELLDIPKSYRESDVNKKVLKPIKEELTPLFRGLTIKKKYGKGRGKPVIGYQFSFKAEHKNADDFFKGNQEENRKKLFNIEHNGELTQEE